LNLTRLPRASKISYFSDRLLARAATATCRARLRSWSWENSRT